MQKEIRIVDAVHYKQKVLPYFLAHKIWALLKTQADYQSSNANFSFLYLCPTFVR